MAMGTAKAKVRQSKNRQAIQRNKVAKARGSKAPKAKVKTPAKTPHPTPPLLTPVTMPVPKATGGKATGKPKATPPPPTPKQLAKQRLQAKVSNGVWLPCRVGLLQIQYFMGVARYYKTHSSIAGYITNHCPRTNTVQVYLPRTRQSVAQHITASINYPVMGTTPHTHYVMLVIPLPNIVPHPKYYPHLNIFSGQIAPCTL